MCLYPYKNIAAFESILFLRNEIWSGMENYNFLARKPSFVLGVTLKEDEKIWLYLLLPPCLRCVAYVFDFAANVAVIYQHFKNGYILWGSMSLMLMYLPAAGHFVVTLSQPKLWKQQDGIWKKIQLVVTRLMQLAFFPAYVMHRFANQFFWAAEAMMQKHAEREYDTIMANQPSDTEIYLFLQPFLQSLPQSFLQLYIMLDQYKLDKRTSHLQVLCIITSITMVAMTVASFLWFESQKITGRKEPWHSVKHIPQNPPSIKSKGHSAENEEETQPSTPFLQPRMMHLHTKPPLPPKPLHLRMDSHTSHNDEDDIIPVPSSPAPPRPATVMLPEPEVHRSNSKRSISFPSYFSSNETKKLSVWTNFHTLPLPERKEQFDSREEDDPLGKFVAFLWWWFFVISRVATLAASAHFQPYLTLGIILVHYIVMLSYLLKKNRCPSIYDVFIQFCMAYVLLFCFFEFKVKLKSVLVFYTAFMVLMTLENLILNVLWYAFNDLDGFWYGYIFAVIFCSYGISIMSMISYFMLLKPKTTTFYGD